MNKEDREELKEMLALVVSPINTLLEEHHRTLFGNGSEGNQGLRVNVDRLIQNKVKEERHFFVLYPLAVSAFLKAGWDLIMRRGGN